MSSELAGLVVLAKNFGPTLSQWLTRRAVLKTAQRIEEKLDDSLLREALAGYDHLRAAANAKTERVRKHELLLARNRFSELCHIDPNKRFTRRWLWVFSTESINPVVLICAGYHGSYCYFAMSGEPDLALQYLYECAVLHPKETLAFFPDIQAFFSRDYITMLRSLDQEHREWEMKLSSCFGASMNPDVQADMDWYCREMVSIESRIGRVLGEVKTEAVSRLRQLSRGLDPATMGLNQLRQSLDLPSLSIES